ncbi:enoyl-CoA hydratase/isomerase family protein [Paenibacillus sp. WQ 127069]|uniref:Enoyl-CoA hydratase/isomerase family protein n=1 Tax=Paenibacillus baimaensis TaxID=2982185 RepID=A0ABT2UF58_9BACL|nr:enoyl-CoA hydratase/isomerase family protein [Paenibacillus sp. WQ 127069]MCU6793275.1 enoyl-CoA hydratase/isomerase family protein [Paenibacillus sp. WQ 127069]
MHTYNQFTVNQKTPAFWRITFHNPPINLIDPDTIFELLTLMNQIETDPDLKVVVFDSADPEYFIAHFDMARAGEKQQTPKEIELPAWIDFATRLYRTSVVTIAEIRGRARGIGSEFALACDMRFASKEKAIFGQPEVGVGVVPGGGANEALARLVGRARALEIVLSADDFDAETAERYGWINRVIPDAELNSFVENLARRISSFDKQTLNEAKKLLNRTGVPETAEMLESRTAFFTGAMSANTQKKVSTAFARGLGKPGDFELHLGQHVGNLE